MLSYIDNSDAQNYKDKTAPEWGGNPKMSMLQGIIINYCKEVFEKSKTQ